ncbi:uncharacterized protein LOC126418798 [Schistocerca serialis cubense]|uniref:uncharacterized protein LOC126418798 n=1 Tax=Schistocerca serialis cubense TaxID=2023355 RepID=UPI00214E0B0B|nr:uncharacterized protein LOC126418798 [Schistocerca serialis cubense]
MASAAACEGVWEKFTSARRRRGTQIRAESPKAPSVSGRPEVQAAGAAARGADVRRAVNQGRGQKPPRELEEGRPLPCAAKHPLPRRTRLRDATGRRDPRREAASPDAASTAAEWAPDKALRCQTPWGRPRKAAAGQAAQPPLGKAARLRGRRPSDPKAVATEEGPQAPERPPGALPDEAAREASTGRAVGVVAATAAAAALGAAAKSEGAAGYRRGPNLWTKNERQNPGGQEAAASGAASSVSVRAGRTAPSLLS